MGAARRSSLVARHPTLEIEWTNTVPLDGPAALLLVALLADYLPVRRMTRIDPM